MGGGEACGDPGGGSCDKRLELNQEWIAHDWEAELPELSEQVLLEFFWRRQAMIKRQKRQMMDRGDEGRSVYRGRLVVFAVHSAIEYVFAAKLERRHAAREVA